MAGSSCSGALTLQLYAGWSWDVRPFLPDAKAGEPKQKKSQEQKLSNNSKGEAGGKANFLNNFIIVKIGRK